MATPPQLNPEQRAAALAKAAQARAARAEFKAKLKMGSVSLADALGKADSDDVVGKLKVVSMLESLPGVGKVKARKVMEEIGIADSRRVRGLGAQQRAALLEQLGK
ncbi:MAG: integration host factor, actinobacterial type [Ilumatobacteraceae bacterium]